MSFEIFSRKATYRGVPSVTFTKTGRMAFNKAATAIFEKNAVENVLLLWDKDKRLIGVRPITKKDNRAYFVSAGTRKSGCGFTAMTFVKYIGLDISSSRAFPTRWDELEEMFLIEVPEEYLNKDGVPSKGKKKPTEGA